VVFYSVGCVDLLPVVYNENNRRELYDDEQKPYQEVSILDQGNI
jgi:hypothetical protein